MVGYLGFDVASIPRTKELMLDPPPAPGDVLCASVPVSIDARIPSPSPAHGAGPGAAPTITINVNDDSNSNNSDDSNNSRGASQGRGRRGPHCPTPAMA